MSFIKLEDLTNALCYGVDIFNYVIPVRNVLDEYFFLIDNIIEVRSSR